jgi:peptide/nickel transport system permease protein
MGRYLIERVLASFVVLILASALVFFTLHLLSPVSFVDETLAAIPNVGNDPDLRASLRHELGLDQPLVVQYGRWIAGATHGDLGESWASGRPVAAQIADTLPLTLEIVVLATLISVAVAVPAGVLSAVKRNTGFDYTCRFLTILGFSIPSFVVGVVLLLSLAMIWGWTPPAPYVPPWIDPHRHILQIFLPVVSLGLTTAAIDVRFLRTAMLDVLHNDFLRTARAKGLRERTVVYRHALRNALLPAVTIFGTQVGFILGGVVAIEQIYSLPGIGRLTLTAIQKGDFPQVQASVLYFLLVFLLVNLAVDLSYAWLDPRIRYN